MGCASSTVVWPAGDVHAADVTVSRELAAFRQVRRRNADRQSVIPTGFQPRNIEHDEATAAALLSVLRGNELLCTYAEDEALVDMVRALDRQAVKAGETLIRQGEEGDRMYVFLRGVFDVLVDGHKVDTFSTSRVLGERALLRDTPRAATVVSREDGDVWFIDRPSFRYILGANSTLRLARFQRALEAAFGRGTLTHREMNRLARATIRVVFNPGQQIIRKGDEGDTMYVLEAGKVRITARGPAGEPLVSHVDVSSERRFFGERALQYNEPRAADVHAEEKTTLLALGRDAVQDLLARLAPLDVDAGGAAAVPARPASADARGAHVPARRPRLGIPLEDLQLGPVLGEGGTARVRAVHHAPSDRSFALKTLSAAMVVERGIQAEVLREADILFRMDHPFIVRLHDTYRDRDRLQLLMELVPGGDLWARIHPDAASPIPSTSTSVDTIRFYSACVLDCLDYFYTHRLLYRDLKPENLMIDADGYVTVVDFGFAKFSASGEPERAVMGTLEYMSPELVRQDFYGRDVDLWAFGVLLYEMAIEDTPFVSYDEAGNPDTPGTEANISTMDLAPKLKGWHDPQLADLIAKLLVRQPINARLGMRGGPAAIKAHPFYKGMDWDALRAKRLPAPWVPPAPRYEFGAQYQPDPVQPNLNDDGEWARDF